MTDSPNDEAPTRKRQFPKRFIPLAMLIGAALFAVVIVGVAIINAPEEPDAAPPAGPALQLADRAGLVTVALSARDDGLAFRLIAPDIDAAPATLKKVTLRTGAGGPESPEILSCGAECLLAPVDLRDGAVSVDARVEFLGRTDTARFRFSWPLGPDATRLARRAIDDTATRDAIVVRERVTSDTRRALVRSPTRTVPGIELARFYAIDGAVDARELPRMGRWRRVVFAVPAVPMWVDLRIGPDGRIERDRVVGESRLFLREMVPEP